MSELSHVNNKGEANMVDVSQKETTIREARATSCITMKPETLQKIKDNSFKKGDVLAVARVAGIMAAKKTHDLIPMCHSLNLSKISVDFEYIENGIQINTFAKLNAQTGVEMEALTAASIAALTIYDMCKAVDRFIKISDTHLVEKKGGKSGHWKLNDDQESPNHETIIWSKDHCGYCVRAKELLNKYKIPFEERNLSSGAWSMDQLLEAAPGVRTMPQIFMDGKHIGGFDDLDAYLFLKFEDQ